MMLLALGAGSTSGVARAYPATGARELGEAVDSGLHLLDQFPGALAAYSLRRLSSSFAGPAIRVRRASDGAESDFGFVGDDLNVGALESWLNGSDGEVTRWYSQLSGHPPLVPHGGLKGPMIAEAGSVILDSEGLPQLKFFQLDGLTIASSGLPTPVLQDNLTIFLVFEADASTPAGSILQMGRNYWERTSLTLYSDKAREYWLSGAGAGFSDPTRFRSSEDRSLVTSALSTSSVRIYDRHELVKTASVATTAQNFDSFTLGAPSRLRAGDGAWQGYVSEITIYPYLSSDEEVRHRYDNANTYWKIGPLSYNTNVLLPQQFDYQVDLYNWLSSITVDEVTLGNASFTWDGTLVNVDSLADLWLQLDGVTASSVVRGEPEWYVLDAGNGKGIEATGEVRIWHEPHGDNPFGSGYGGNPARAWANEPAFLYQLHVPMADGSEGNPYYRDPALARRALIVAAVDMMMYHRIMLQGGSGAWTDMFGKALLGWSEAYRWCKEILDSNTQRAFETGFSHFLEKVIEQGARAVNTNMDMFPMHAAAEIYVATDDLTLKQTAVQAVKRTLFGYSDGRLGEKHSVFATGGHRNGVFGPAGYIMEGDQPDVFYQGESIYHLMGALSVVTDRNTSQVLADWAFLEEVVKRMVEWEAHQVFYDPGGNAPESGGLRTEPFYHAGAGFAGRTGAGAPDGQAGQRWKLYSLADRFPAGRFRARDIADLTRSRMEQEVSKDLAILNTAMASTYQGAPPVWSGWSPWTKATPYLPPKGWYSRLTSIHSSTDPARKPLVEQSGVYYNKSFGGYPTGEEYWAYKNSDGTREWGFFVEAHARQGVYGGWYGGKIETFWTETTGVVLLNRHGKTGCDGSIEDSVCWDNLEYKAGHHVWGRDENGKGFTTLLLRGHDLQRTAAFDLGSSTPTVSVKNVFNDPSHSGTSSNSGEQTGSELQGRVEVTNRFEAVPTGVRVTHTISSDETDEASELWASLPVFLRLFSTIGRGDMYQRGFKDTSIEFWNGSSWLPMPEDRDMDGVPDLISTTSLRLGRDYMRGDGLQYVYVAMNGRANVRLATRIYEDPYQTNTRVRTVHIDLHGNPGTVKKLPAESSVTYTITTTDPEAGKNHTTLQEINLSARWNWVSGYVAPAAADLDKIFAGVLPNIVLMKNKDGKVFNPSKGIDDIGTWNPAEGYMVYAAAPVTLMLEGALLDPASTTISLKEGWNLVPYLRVDSMPIEDALASLAAHLVVVKDNLGQIYFPAHSINSIGSMQPNRAYRIYVKQPVTFRYPSNVAPPPASQYPRTR